MINFDTYGGNVDPSAIGQYRVLDPVEIVHSHNPNNSVNPIQEVYQNLPQLNRPIFVPAYSVHNDLSRVDSYRLEQGRPVEDEVRPLNVRTRVYPFGMGSPSRNVLHRKGSPGNGEIKRDGWGWGDSGHHHDSPALSALALLGFMFFLNLIQTSLQNNRQLLAAKATAATGTVVAAGRSNVDGLLRYRRNSPPFIGQDPYTTSGIDSTLLDPNVVTASVENPIKYTQMEQPPHPPYKSVSLRKAKRRKSSKFMDDDQINYVNSRDPPNDLTPLPTYPTNSREDPIESFKSMSLQCFQLIACKLGRSILESLDGTTGVVVRMLGTTLIPKIPQKTWTGRLMRAFNKSWNHAESCEAMFRKCESLSRILNIYTSNKVQSLRRKKSF